MNEMPPGVKVMHDAYQRWAEMGPVSLTITRQDAWTVMMALQATKRMPGMTPGLSRQMESIGRQFQEAVCDDAELYGLAEAGWNPELDVEE